MTWAASPLLEKAFVLFLLNRTPVPGLSLLAVEKRLIVPICLLSVGLCLSMTGPQFRWVSSNVVNRFVGFSL